MILGQDTFLTWIKGMVMGGGRDSAGNPANDAGFLVDRPDLIGSSVLATSVTRIADSDGFGVLNAAAGITAVGVFNVSVPRDYDENTDILNIRFAAKMGGATDVPTLTVVAKKALVGGAASTMTAVSGSPTAALSATGQQFEIQYRGQGLVRNQRVVFTLTSGAHATDALQLQAFRIAYRSTLVSYNELDASNLDLR